MTFLGAFYRPSFTLSTADILLTEEVKADFIMGLAGGYEANQAHLVAGLRKPKVE
jgi:hypothetical protein